MTQQKQCTIHFVCLGNVYRSRYAESYAKSKQTQHSFSSSGLLADANYFGPISWWGARLAYNAGVSQHLTPMWTQTKQRLLDEADLVIFMHASVEERARKMFNLESITFRTWDIEDLMPSQMNIPEADKERESMRQSDVIARKIEKNIDELLDECDKRTM